MAKQKGDILVRRNNDYVEELPVGSDGQALIVDSTQDSGFRWDSVVTEESADLSNTYTIEVSGNISGGKFAVLNPNDTASEIKLGDYEMSTTTDSGANVATTLRPAFDENTGYGVVYYYSSDDSRSKWIPFDASGTTVSFGTEVDTTRASTNTGAMTYHAGIQRIVNFHHFFLAKTPYIDILTTTGGVVAAEGGRQLTEISSGVDEVAMAYDPDTDRLIISYQEGFTANAFARTVQIVGTTITLGAAAVLGTTGNSRDCLAYDTTYDKAVFFTLDGGCRLATITGGGSTINFLAGTATDIDGTGSYSNTSVAFNPNIGRTVVAYGATTNAFINVVNASGTTPTFGTKASFSVGNVSSMGVVVNPDDGKMFVVYEQITTGDGAYREIFVSGDVVTLGSEVVYHTATNDVNEAEFVYDTTNNKIVALASETTTSYALYASTLEQGASPLQADNLLGVALDSYTDGTTGTFGVFGYLDTQQSGLSANTDYFINNNGTLGTDGTQPWVGHAVSDTEIIIKGTDHPLFSMGEDLWNEIVFQSGRIDTNIGDISALSGTIDSFFHLTKLDSNLTWTIGSAGDYTTLQAAIADARNYYQFGDNYIELQLLENLTTSSVIDMTELDVNIQVTSSVADTQRTINFNTTEEILFDKSGDGYLYFTDIYLNDTQTYFGTMYQTGINLNNTSDIRLDNVTFHSGLYGINATNVDNIYAIDCTWETTSKNIDPMEYAMMFTNVGLATIVNPTFDDIRQAAILAYDNTTVQVEGTVTGISLAGEDVTADDNSFITFEGTRTGFNVTYSPTLGTVGNNQSLISVATSGDHQLATIGDFSGDISTLQADDAFLSGAIDAIDGLTYWQEAQTGSITTFRPITDNTSTIFSSSDTASILDGSNWSTIVNGNGCALSGNYSNIVGGWLNQCNSNYSSIVGGVTNFIRANGQSSYNFIGGGWGCQILGDFDFATIVCGNSQVISGSGLASFMGGGQQNTIDGDYVTVIGGHQNDARWNYSVILGGYQNKADGYGSVVSGRQAVSRSYGQSVHASGQIAQQGDAQGSRHICRRLITSDIEIMLLPTGSTTGIIMADKQTVSFLGTITARTSGATPDVASWKVEGVVSYDGTTVTVHQSVITEIYNPNGWTAGVSSTSNYFAPTVTITGWTENVHAVATIDTSEVIFE